MKTKYREAVANLAKQANLKKTKQIDPLSTICAEMRKTKLISKPMLPSTYKQLFQKKANPGELSKQTKAASRRVYKNKQKKEVQKSISSEWIRFLPQECDQFDYNPNIEFEKKNLVETEFIQNQKQGSLAFQEQETSKFNIQTFNIEEFKRKLGIGVKAQAPQIELKEEKKIECPKEETGKPSLLPFAGRPFEQAPARPVPKKIHEYPPTCKVAGLYQWPPPKSQYRQWKMQMKQSRKLN